MFDFIHSKKPYAPMLALTSLLAGCALEGEAEVEANAEEVAQTTEALSRTQCDEVTQDHLPYFKCYVGPTGPATYLHKVETSAKAYYDFTTREPKAGTPEAFITAMGTNPPPEGESAVFTVYGGFKSHDPNAPLMLKNSLNRLPYSHVQLFWELGLNFIVADLIAGNNKPTGGATMPGNPTNVSWQSFRRDKDNYGLNYSITVLHELGHTFVNERDVRASVNRTCGATLKANCVTTAERAAIAGMTGGSVTKLPPAPGDTTSPRVWTTLEQDLNGCSEYGTKEKVNCGRAERLCDLYEKNASGTLSGTLATVAKRLYGPI